MTTTLELSRSQPLLFVSDIALEQTNLTPVAAATATGRALFRVHDRLVQRYGETLYTNTSYMVSDICRYTAGQSIKNRLPLVQQLYKERPNDIGLADLIPTCIAGNELPVLRLRELGIACTGLMWAAYDGSAEAADVLVSPYVGAAWEAIGQPLEAAPSPHHFQEFANALSRRILSDSVQ